MSFTWDSVNCETLGMRVEKYSPRVFPARQDEVIPVPGRSGSELIEIDAYSNYNQEYEVYFSTDPTDPDSYRDRAAAIAKWLLGTGGYKALTDTYDRKGRIQYARIIGGMDFVNSMNDKGRGKLVFDCQPQRYQENETPVTGTADGTETVQALTFPTNAVERAQPLITVDAGTYLDAGESVIVKCYEGATSDERWAIKITSSATGGPSGHIVIDTETGEVTVGYADEWPDHVDAEVDGEITDGVRSGDRLSFQTDYAAPATQAPTISYSVLLRAFEI